MPSDLQELQQQVQGILRKLDQIPFDTLGQDAHRVMTGLEATLKRLDAVPTARLCRKSARRFATSAGR